MTVFIDFQEVFSGERCGPWASCSFLDHYFFKDEKKYTSLIRKWYVPVRKWIPLHIFYSINVQHIDCYFIKGL